MTSIRAGVVALAVLLTVSSVGCGTKSETDVATQDESAIQLPAVTPPPDVTSASEETRPTEIASPPAAPPTAAVEADPVIPATTYPPDTGEPAPTFALPPGKVPCMIMYGTLLPGDEKDVPVYRTDGSAPEQIATIHLPDGVWTPAEAKELCA